jgi:hypothetical protein
LIFIKNLRNRQACFPKIDPHQTSRFAIRHTASNQKEVAMPVDSILVSAAVVAVFAIFSAVLIWGDFRSGSMSRQPAGPARKRRSF